MGPCEGLSDIAQALPPSRTLRNLLVPIQVYAELQSCLDARVLEETTAVETTMAMARDGIDRQSLIEYDWQLQVRPRDTTRQLLGCIYHSPAS